MIDYKKHYCVTDEDYINLDVINGQGDFSISDEDLIEGQGDCTIERRHRNKSDFCEDALFSKDYSHSKKDKHYDYSFVKISNSNNDNFEKSLTLRLKK